MLTDWVGEDRRQAVHMDISLCLSCLMLRRDSR